MAETPIRRCDNMPWIFGNRR